MSDRDFLIWIHERLEHVHGEDALVDYMHKLRSIIFRLPKEQSSGHMYSFNSLEELQQELAEKDLFNAAPIL